jgi:hypothetical protein
VTDFGHVFKGKRILEVGLFNLHSVNLVAHANGVLAQPVFLKLAVIDFALTSDQIAYHCNHAGRKATLGQQVHLDFLHYNQLVDEWAQIE